MASLEPSAAALVAACSGDKFEDFGPYPSISCSSEMFWACCVDSGDAAVGAGPAGAAIEGAGDDASAGCDAVGAGAGAAWTAGLGGAAGAG